MKKNNLRQGSQDPERSAAATRTRLALDCPCLMVKCLLELNQTLPHRSSRGRWQTPGSRDATVSYPDRMHACIRAGCLRWTGRVSLQQRWTRCSSGCASSGYASRSVSLGDAETGWMGVGAVQSVPECAGASCSGHADASPHGYQTIGAASLHDLMWRAATVHVCIIHRQHRCESALVPSEGAPAGVVACVNMLDSPHDSSAGAMRCRRRAQGGPGMSQAKACVCSGTWAGHAWAGQTSGGRGRGVGQALPSLCIRNA